MWYGVSTLVFRWECYSPKVRKFDIYKWFNQGPSPHTTQIWATKHVAFGLSRCDKDSLPGVEKHSGVRVIACHSRVKHVTYGSPYVVRYDNGLSYVVHSQRVTKDSYKTMRVKTCRFCYKKVDFGKNTISPNKGDFGSDHISWVGSLGCWCHDSRRS